MTALDERTVVTEPGVYDIPAEVYHADPVPGGSLSSTGARRLLAPSCPALFRHEQLHGQPHRRVFDVGQAAHMLVLGAGPRLVVVDVDDWRTRAAREARDEAYAAGAIPLLPHEYAEVEAMASALRAHPVAAALFAPGAGSAEQSLFWQDDRTGVWLRARLDWLPAATGGRLIVPDYKTARSAEPGAIARSVHEYGYHQQAAWYLDGLAALGMGSPARDAFLFVVQEKQPPYLVTVVELDEVALTIGRHRNRQAIDLYERCARSGEWPGYSRDIELVSLPPWAERAALEEIQ